MAEWRPWRPRQQTFKDFSGIHADRAIVVDVYADWCVACQPIGHHYFKAPT